MKKVITINCHMQDSIVVFIQGGILWKLPNGIMFQMNWYTNIENYVMVGMN